MAGWSFVISSTSSRVADGGVHPGRQAIPGRPIRDVSHHQGAGTGTRRGTVCPRRGRGDLERPPERQLRPLARETLDAANAAKDAVNATLGDVQGTVSVGTLTSIAWSTCLRCWSIPRPASRGAGAAARPQARVRRGWPGNSVTGISTSRFSLAPSPPPARPARAARGRRSRCCWWCPPTIRWRERDAVGWPSWPE